MGLDFENHLAFYTKAKCIYCVMLKDKLELWNIKYTEFDYSADDNFTKYPQLQYMNEDVLHDDTSGLTLELLVERCNERSEKT